MNASEIKEILEKHVTWLKDEGGERADLCGANLRGADLYGADLCGANLRGADLYGADLYGANLRGANLHEADLRGADLYGANLHEADLRGANLYGANLYGADLYGADLRGAGVAQVNFSKWTMTVTATHIYIGCERIANDAGAGEALTTLAERYEAVDLLPAYLEMLRAANAVIHQ